MAHLGGHANICNIDVGVLRYFRDAHGCDSFLDVGCGTGEMVSVAKEMGYSLAMGIEGDTGVVKDPSSVIIHDFNVSPVCLPFQADLVYSCEFLEHIREEVFLRNASNAFKGAKFVVMTAAPVGWTGKNHLNEQNHEYWIRAFNRIGYEHSPELTRAVRDASTMNIERPMAKRFMKHRGLVFVPRRNCTPIDTEYRFQEVPDNIVTKPTHKRSKKMRKFISELPICKIMD